MKKLNLLAIALVGSSVLPGVANAGLTEQRVTFDALDDDNEIRVIYEGKVPRLCYIDSEKVGESEGANSTNLMEFRTDRGTSIASTDLKYASDATAPHAYIHYSDNFEDAESRLKILFNDELSSIAGADVYEKDLRMVVRQDGGEAHAALDMADSFNVLLTENGLSRVGISAGYDVFPGDIKIKDGNDDAKFVFDLELTCGEVPESDESESQPESV